MSRRVKFSRLTPAQVSYGGVRMVLDAVGKRHLLLDPYVTLVAMGGVLMPLSALGFWAAVSGARRTLFMFFCSVMLTATVLIYASALCFVYASNDVAARVHVLGPGQRGTGPGGGTV